MCFCWAGSLAKKEICEILRENLWMSSPLLASMHRIAHKNHKKTRIGNCENVKGEFYITNDRLFKLNDNRQNRVEQRTTKIMKQLIYVVMVNFLPSLCLLLVI